VRETLATDGGLERLVSILHECKKDVSSVAERKARGMRKTIAEEKQDALIAWKWTLAFQCLVLIGTRGTEKIRERVVQAGVIPIIATVLDNYLLVSRDFDGQTDTTLNEKFINMVKHQVNISTARQKTLNASISSDDDAETLLSNYISMNSELSHYLTETQYDTEIAPDMVPNMEINGLQILQNITEMSIHQNLHDINHTITSPRFFLRGILIPKDDDVVWSLQLLAFISKYSSLKYHLQSTHIVESLSLRSLLRDCISPASIPPPLDTDDDPEIELISNLSSDESEQQSHAVTHSSQLNQQNAQALPPLTQSSVPPSSQRVIEPQTQPQSGAISASQSQILIQMNNSSQEDVMNDNGQGHTNGIVVKSAQYHNELLNDYQQPKTLENNTLLTGNDKTKNCITKSLLNSILKFEKCCLRCSQKDDVSKLHIQDYTSNEEKTFNFIELSCKLNNFYSKKCMSSKISRIKKCIKEKEEYLTKWNYETYFLNNTTESDIDHTNDVSEYINIFPLVEKFTIKSINTTDMCYWSGVIMRNSCRKNDTGVRQCACFDCGKWEKFPRQFAKCRRCKRTKYCSKDCQLKAWVYHKHWCLDSSSSSTNSHATTKNGDNSSAAGDSQQPVRPGIQPAPLTENL
jgi:hypothetical protein